MRPKQPLHKIFLSVIAALFGIQSSKKAQDDFKESSPWIFIFIGIGLLLCLIGGLATVVFLVTRPLS